MAPVLRNQGAAFYTVGGYPPKNAGVKLLAPDPLLEGVADLVTYTDLFVFCTMIISLLNLFIQIHQNKKK